MRNGMKKISIKNYQSIKNAEIELGGITVITGRTDSGKSAFFRAVKAVVSNESGDDFTTFGEKKTVVEIDNVKWIQSNTENSYEIDGKRWDKCGRTVPDDVRKELNMGEIEFGKDIKFYLNFSGQLDPSFIVQGNPSDNAKVIGSISNIHTVYNGLREAEKDAKNIKHTMTESQEQLIVLQKQLEAETIKYDSFNRYHNQLKEIYLRSKEIDAKLKEFDAIMQLCISFNNEYKKCQSDKKCYKGIDFKAIYGKIDDLMALEGMKIEYGSLAQHIDSVKRRNIAYKGISVNEWYKKVEEYESLLKLKLEVLRVSEAEKDNKKALDLMNHAMAELNKNLITFDICDVCGSPKEAWRM